MKKMLSILLVLLLIPIFPISSFADGNATELNEKNINELLEKYGLEIESSTPLANEVPEDSIYSLEELEKIIIEELNKPKEIKVEDIHIVDEPNISLPYSLSNNTYSRARATSGVATLHHYSEVYNGLKIRYTATGRYTTSKGKKRWTRAVSSSVSQYSSSSYSKLKRVIKSTAQVTDGGKRLTQNYKFQVQNYLAVPIPKLDKVIRVKAGAPMVEGRVHHYANKI